MTQPHTYNATLDFIDRNVDEGRGSNLAFDDLSRTLTYFELKLATQKVVSLFRGAGYQQEDRVAILAQDTVDFPIVFWGAIRAGVVPVLLNTLLSGTQYAYMLSHSRAKALFVSSSLLDVVAPHLADLPFLKRVFVLGHHVEAHEPFQTQLDAQAPSEASPQTSSDEVAFWLYSSGSTGAPKGVPHVHSSLMETYRCYGASVLGIEEDDLVFSAAKLFFAYGLGNAMTFPMAVGAGAVLLPERPTPEAVFSVLSEREPTIFFGVPTLYAALLAEGAGKGPAKRSPRLRRCISAGEGLPKDVAERWKTAVGLDILDGVGSTEMLHIFLSNRPDDVLFGASGVPVPGYAVRLMDETGEQVGPGVVGEMYVRGRSAANGYWNQREKSRRTFTGEWTRTGDKYTYDEEGRYYYHGRTDDMFKVSGIWVSPFEVESALVAHAAVLEAAVVPYEDEDGLLKPHAFVVLTTNRAISETELASELQELVRSTIGTWKYPRRITFVKDLPKTATGKIQRFKLRGEVESQGV